VRSKTVPFKFLEKTFYNIDIALTWDGNPCPLSALILGLYLSTTAHISSFVGV